MRSETFDTPEPPELRINLPSGDVRVETSAEATQTHVEISGPSEDEARIEQRRDRIVIEIERKKLFGGASYVRDHQLLVTAPSGTHIDASLASADFDGSGRLGDVSIDTASGDVRLAAVAGRLESNTASGDVRVDFVGGDVRVNSASGHISVGEAERDAKIRSASGDIEVRSAVRGKVDLTSASGDIEIGIRRGSKVFIDAGSVSGDMSSELDVTDAPPSGSDGPHLDLRARTLSGDVTVRRA